MIEIESVADIKALRESRDVECKLAGGRDGKGELPKDIWETYSAFANTDGGDIILGLRERKDFSFELIGIENPQKLLDELWMCLNNPQKISDNVLRERWVKVIEIEGKSVVYIHVPRAPRKQKPVHLKGNPLTGTYKRLNSSDIKASNELVRRMMAEQVEDSRDNEILKGYGPDDLDIEGLNVYRQIYANRDPDHPWNHVEAQEFLYNIGAWRKDRETGSSGMTKAGLLMFGRLPAIKEAFPNYMLDYQERPEAKTEARWVDLLTIDGSWSGNVFDFYRRVIRKLTSELKVPFILEGDQRQDDTLVHKALREALVNTLVHADYTGRASILVVKRLDMFAFRNPGLMRIPRDYAIKGGESDCRNRLLQDMFRYIGLGENAGSGLPKIYQGWTSQHWRKPTLKELEIPSEQTLLELHMLSLVPEKVLEELQVYFGDAFNSLCEEESLVLVTAFIEKTIDHGRMMSVMDIHPRDLSKLLASLTERNFLQHEGTGRGTIYFLAQARLNDLLDTKLDDILEALGNSSGGLGDSSGGLDESSGGFPAELEKIAKPIAERKRAPRQEVESAIIGLCSEREITLESLSLLLNRSTDVLRKDYLQPLLKNKRLRYRYPTIPSHPDQAYMRKRGRFPFFVRRENIYVQLAGAIVEQAAG